MRNKFKVNDLVDLLMNLKETDVKGVEVDLDKEKGVISFSFNDPNAGIYHYRSKHVIYIDSDC